MISKLFCLALIFLSSSGLAEKNTYTAKDILQNLELNTFGNSLSHGIYGKQTTFKQTEFTNIKSNTKKHIALINKDNSWMISLKILGIKRDEYTVCFEDFSLIRPPTYAAIHPLLIKKVKSGNFIVVKEIKKSIPGCTVYYH
ncbi:pesticin immunity protein [Salmonella enterica]|nr:pesticin immunity protein [Salmonella enterica]EJY0131402.1 pesticin immunity protein [Salmonella enterica]EJY5182182.1 pesticin immunity protein [Salmonella enterica]EKB4038208.1 pesticin immunity protein [Salmonella enterica]